jgi:hypothetical protein
MKISLFIRPVVLLVYCGLLGGLSGCATVDQKVGLNYARHDDSLVRHSGDIYVTRGVPGRATKNSKGEWIIGALNNVHGIHQADLLSDRSPDEWITDALLHELRQAGYRVSYVESLPTAVARGIAITNVTVFLTVNKGAISADTRHELKFNTEVFLNGDKVKTFTIASRDDRTVPLNASQEEKERILLQSLQEAMQQTVPEIIMLIDKK